MTANRQKGAKRESHKQKEQMLDKHVSARIQKHSAPPFEDKRCNCLYIVRRPLWGQKMRESHKHNMTEYGQGNLEALHDWKT